MSEEIKKDEYVKGEIDLLNILRTIWLGKKRIFKSIVICLIIGVIIILGTPKEYKSEVKLLVESGSNTSNIGGLIQQFGGLAGINIGANKGEDALTPMLYPDIVKSTPFLIEVLQQKVQISKSDSTILVSDYLTTNIRLSLFGIIKKYTIGLPGTIIGWIRHSKKDDDISIKKQESKSLIRLTQKQYDLLQSLSDLVKVNQDDETEILTISVETQDPIFSAMLADKINDLLTRYIIEYRIQKAKVDLLFIEERHKEAELRYRNAQSNLAHAKDQNKNIVLASAQINEENLLAEYNLTFNVYNSFSQQLEQAKLKVQEKTPVFKVLEPAKIPLQKSKPRTGPILISMIFFGVIIGIMIIVLNVLLKKLYVG